jgi:hypothetical protein
MDPSDGGIVPVMQLKSVVLPAPLGPIRDTISPSSRLMETSLRAFSPPKALVTPLTSSSAMVFPYFSSGRNLSPRRYTFFSGSSNRVRRRL